MSTGYALTFAPLFVCLVIAVAANSCESDAAKATQAVESSGLHDVAIGPSHMFGAWHGCAQEEYAREFSATRADGSRVKGVTCCGPSRALGPVKGCTVRW